MDNKLPPRIEHALDKFIEAMEKRCKNRKVIQNNVIEDKK